MGSFTARARDFSLALFVFHCAETAHALSLLLCHKKLVRLVATELIVEQRDENEVKVALTAHLEKYGYFSAEKFLESRPATFWAASVKFVVTYPLLDSNRHLPMKMAKAHPTKVVRLY